MIKFIKVGIHYQQVQILENLSFELNKGQKMAIKGRSGSGKSSVLKAILGFSGLNSGEILWNNKSITGNEKSIRKQTSYVPQDIWTPFELVKDFLLFPFGFKQNQNVVPQENDILELFDKLGLKPHILNKNIKEISGGEKQRIALCSSLLLKKDLLIWDEPTSALDPQTKENLWEHLSSNKSITLIASTHDAFWTEKSDTVINTEDYIAK